MEFGYPVIRNFFVYFIEVHSGQRRVFRYLTLNHNIFNSEEQRAKTSETFPELKQKNQSKVKKSKQTEKIYDEKVREKPKLKKFNLKITMIKFAFIN